ncbi:TPA: Flp pilus assembly protein CpaB [Burkholderia vietnamiensis]|uniref:Flp pilus assembly protein CpaB n=1 Tax=Burkholderia vietnamiensis TaxID=60552 RepID=UPI000754DC61|nr:Flp pilus assembly protein CpaB [Burkholderia vietnamiensis]KVF25650.1 Flp pilus assembly protein CpaB [Burkholderia vietnamiensis]KVS09433.1 Flp pilus assembly protein CpaB [Burkholderia vietnamiensis]MCA8210545.1 Flp pilus assembly protein CpaB [Burkholderia vietnamiensis]HDR9101672.1 Flp pilus assembly protein CpaB [Burkholderia vietnamiensis]HDR9119930.1 Flp pilus assembly protein CpaB [Burkholderia vietnamiensis]
MTNNLTKIIAGLLIAIAVLLGIYAWMLGRSAPASVPAPQVVTANAAPVVIATHALPAGQPIPADALKVQSISPVPTGAFMDPTMVAGRVPARDIPASAPITPDALVSGLAEDIQPGERAIAVRVDETNAVGNRLRPGNFVDVFLNLKREGGGAMFDGEVSQTQARLLMSKVRVLSFGDATPERDSGSTTNGSNGQPSNARIAVLAVPTAQVDALTLGEATGRLTLALRNPRDDELAMQTVAVRTDNKLSPSALAAAGVSLQQLSGTQRNAAAANVNVPPLPSHLQPAVRSAAGATGSGGSIEVIRGGRSETVAY